MKNIIILGAGYGGIAAVLSLSRQCKSQKDIQITLVDKRDYHLYNANLYEAATAEEELVSQAQVKKTIAMPIAEILAGSMVTYLQGEVKAINTNDKHVQVGTRTLPFDSLVVALGSVSDYFGIEGAEKYSVPLKNLPNAIHIRNQVEFAIQSHRLDVNKKNIRIVIAGGGYTGVEFAAELFHEIKFIAWKNQYPPEKIEIVIVEAMPQLIPGFSDKLSQDVLWHMKQKGVRVMLSSPIKSVDALGIDIVGGERLPYDLLVWTTGVKAPSLPFTVPVNTDRKGRIITNEFLQADFSPFVFAVGDSACVLNADGKPAPPTAQDAIEHGEYVGYALPMVMKNAKPKPYQGKKHGFIVTLGGKYAILDYGGFYVKGFLAYLVRFGVSWNYYRSVVGIWKAT